MVRSPKSSKSSKSSKQVDALKHEAATRRNIPTAEMESFFRRDEDASPMPMSPWTTSSMSPSTRCSASRCSHGIGKRAIRRSTAYEFSTYHRRAIGRYTG